MQGPILAAEINTLPPRLRDYVRDLEQNVDPSGILAENAALRENLMYLCLIVQRQRKVLEQFGISSP